MVFTNIAARRINANCWTAQLISNSHMKRLIAVATIICSVSSFAAPDKVAYELQERCGKQVSTEFKREFGNGIVKTKTNISFTAFRNHYNAKLNACMYLQMVTGRTIEAGKPPLDFTMQTLFNFNENREIGSYYKKGLDEDGRWTVCNIDGRICKSRAEWEALIKPYMEE